MYMHIHTYTIYIHIPYAYAYGNMGKSRWEIDIQWTLSVVNSMGPQNMTLCPNVMTFSLNLSVFLYWKFEERSLKSIALPIGHSRVEMGSVLFMPIYM